MEEIAFVDVNERTIENVDILKWELINSKQHFI
jgi:hypothetical protein